MRQGNLFPFSNKVAAFLLQVNLVGWLFGFYCISTFVGYLTPIHFYENNSISNNYVMEKYAV